jgi:hypothetical protein
MAFAIGHDKSSAIETARMLFPSANIDRAFSSVTLPNKCRAGFILL